MPKNDPGHCVLLQYRGVLYQAVGVFEGPPIRLELKDVNERKNPESIQ